MRVLIMAPNGGASLSTGGGTRLILEMASILAENASTQVTLAGFHALPLEGLESLHGLRLPRARTRVMAGPGARAYDAFRGSPFKLTPYLLGARPSFRRWVRSVVRSSDPDIVWFHDDVPPGLDELLHGRRVFLYVHFPFRGRTSECVPPIHQSETLSERVSLAALQAVDSLVVERYPDRLCEQVWTNSSVTARVYHDLGGRPPRVVYAPVRSRASGWDPSPGKLEVVSVGAFNVGKGFSTLVRAMGLVETRSLHLTIAGTARDSRYLKELRSLIRRRGLEDRVQLETDLPWRTVDELMARAAIVVNPAVFEPFGLAFAEAMGKGAYPIARASEWNGGWTDILDRGTFGPGFEDAPDLARLLDRSSHSLSPGTRAGSVDRIRAFGRDVFSTALQEVTN